VWRLRRPHFHTGGYCSLDFENTGLIAEFRDTYVGPALAINRSQRDYREPYWTGENRLTGGGSRLRSLRARTRRWSRSAAMAASSFRDGGQSRLRPGRSDGELRQHFAVDVVAPDTDGSKFGAGSTLAM
jgi:hypothetical protein